MAAAVIHETRMAGSDGWLAAWLEHIMKYEAGEGVFVKSLWIPAKANYPTAAASYLYWEFS